MQKYNDILYPVEFWSKTFGEHEKHWHVSRKELVSIVWICEKWDSFLIGPKFDVYTDHRNLTFLMDPTHKGLLAKKLLRWLVRLQAYDMDCYYIEGLLNVGADHGSRDGFKYQQVVPNGRSSSRII